MSDQPISSVAAAVPEPGLYPVPGHHHHKSVVDRRWDGEVWTNEVQPAPDGTTLPAYKKHFFFLFRGGNWKFLLLYVVFAFAAIMLWETDKEAKWVSGIQILLVPTAGVATAVVLYSVVWRLIGRRVGFGRISVETRNSIIKWGIVSALAGFAFALAIELLVPKIFGGSPKDSGWSALAGPAEETGKLLIPVILWFKGRFRLPREGYFLVLASAGFFGLFEGIEYAVNPEHWQVSRPIFEMMHPLLTGFVAAVAWQAAWHRETIITKAAVGAWVLAMVAHSTNDVLVLSKDMHGALVKLTSFITLFTVIVMYLLQKHSARQMVPPDQVGEVSPRWRPVAPKGAENPAQT